MAIEVKAPSTKSPTTKIHGLRVYIKTSDGFCGNLTDEKGQPVGEDYEGYVPSFFPNDGEDYIDLEIDIETGKIENWKKPSAKQLEKFLKAAENKECQCTDE